MPFAEASFRMGAVFLVLPTVVFGLRTTLLAINREFPVGAVGGAPTNHSHVAIPWLNFVAMVRCHVPVPAPPSSQFPEPPYTAFPTPQEARQPLTRERGHTKQAPTRRRPCSQTKEAPADSTGPGLHGKDVDPGRIEVLILLRHKFL